MISFLHRHDGNDLIIGGAASEDYIYAGNDNDLATGDCVLIAFGGRNLISSITSIHDDMGKDDELQMGLGDDIAIGGMGDDRIAGGEGNDILLGDNAAVAFYSSEAMLPDHLWSIPMTATSKSCQYGGEDIISGGAGAVDYM